MVFSLLTSPKLIYSQGEWNKWYFGWQEAIDFNSGSPLPLGNSTMYAHNITISVSDSIGNLLFYSDGDNIFDRDGFIMPNGSGLLGSIGDATEPVLAVKDIIEDSIYFLFTVSELPYVGLHYSLLDMRLNGGFGDIVPGMKNIPVIGGDSASVHLCAVRHHNNRDIWIVTTKYGNVLQYASFLLTSTGLIEIPVLSNSSFSFIGYGDAGQMKISQDGTKLACNIDTIVEICNFNNVSGEVIPLFTFRPKQDTTPPYFCRYNAYGVEYSVDTKFIYITGTPYRPPGSQSNVLCQYDATQIDSSQFMASEVVLDYNTLDNQAIFALQLGPDNRIYCSPNDIDSLHIINFPSLPGSSCNFQKNAVPLSWFNHPYGSLPQFLQKYKAYIHYSGYCQNDSIHFSGDIWPPADTIRWNFGDPSSGTMNISYDTTPSHVFTSSGIYTVELYVRHIDNRTDTSWVTITIDETPDPDLGPDQTICQGDSITLDAGACTGCTFEWSSIPPGFSSTEQTVTLLQSGIYIVAVSSTNGCTGRDTIQLTVTEPPIITNSPLFKSICSGETTDISLTSNLPGTSFSWNATSSSPAIIGFGPGTGDTIDQVLTNTGTSPEIVTYTITPSLGDCEGDSVEYVVTVTPGDSVLVSVSASEDSICQGTQISFIATPTYGGSAPGYQWKVNGINQGTNNSVFNHTPSNDDTVCCILTSSDTVCISNNPATSNEIIMTVYPNLPVIISISSTNNPVCEGSTAIFTASTSNKGASPNFQWVVNGNPVGSNDSIYSYVPSNGDQISCILTSSEQCTTNNPATSDMINMIVNPLLPVGISISASANPVCEELPVTFTATPGNGGTMPAYQWQVNGINTGTNNPNFTYTPVDEDVVTCILTSNAECITNNPTTSNSITMSVGESPNVNFTICFDTITTLNAKPFKLMGGIPLGGTYSGPGVDQITGYFNPAMAGVGLKTISYSYSNLFNCSNNATRAISVINPAPFSCSDSLIDIRDNKKYPTVQIGSQCWLAVNLNHGQQVGGSLTQRDNCLVEKYCYNDLPANCIQYGALYQWDELMRYEDSEEIQGLCPPGWHIPSESDWNQLFTIYQGNAFAGSPLLYTGYSGFNVLLAGVEFFNQSHCFADFASIMWSSTSHGPYKAWSHGLNEYNYSVSYYPSYRSNAFSVRCVRD